jgi:hypothetical protein
MGDILAFPRQSAHLAKRGQFGGDPGTDFSACEIAISAHAHRQIVKALLFSLASLEAALVARAKAIKQLPDGDCREQLLAQQKSLAVMVYQAQRMLAECEPPANTTTGDTSDVV